MSHLKKLVVFLKGEGLVLSEVILPLSGVGPTVSGTKHIDLS